MAFTLLKMVVSALVVGGVNVLARANPQLGGWVAALPVVSILSILWLAADGVPASEIGAFTSRVLLGLAPTAVLLAIIAACLARGLPLALALGGAAVVWVGLTVAARRFGLLA